MRTGLIGGVVLSCVLAPQALGQTLNQEFKLLPDDAVAQDRFGESVSIADGIVAVGAPKHEVDGESGAGAVYLFDASTGAQLRKFTSPDPAAGDDFGNAVAIGDGVVAVGARFDDDNGTSSGAAFLFDAGGGPFVIPLVPDDAAASDRLGRSIAIGDGIVAVGATGDDESGFSSGAVYLFDAFTGAQLQKLLPEDGAASDRFGRAVAIDNGIVVVGAPFDDDNGSQSGSAYVFYAPTGAQLAKLVPDDGAEDHMFGNAVAIRDGLIAVGAEENGNYDVNHGVVYLYQLSTAAESDRVLPLWHLFGASVAIGADGIAAGAPGGAGQAFLLDPATGDSVFNLLSDDIPSSASLGTSIGIADGVVVAGSPGDDENGANSGSVHVFSVSPGPCVSADLAEPYGVLDFDDVLAFLVSFGAGCE